MDPNRVGCPRLIGLVEDKNPQGPIFTQMLSILITILPDLSIIFPHFLHIWQEKRWFLLVAPSKPPGWGDPRGILRRGWGRGLPQPHAERAARRPSSVSRVSQWGCNGTWGDLLLEYYRDMTRNSQYRLYRSVWKWGHLSPYYVHQTVGNMMINDQAWGVFHLWNILFLESKRFCKLEERVVATLWLWPMDERLGGIPLSAEVILIATWTAARSYIYICILYKCHRICFFCVEHFRNVFDDQQYEPLDDVRWNHVLPVRLFGGGQIKILCLASRIELPEHSYNHVFFSLAATLRKVMLLESTESWWKLCSREGPETL